MNHSKAEIQKAFNGSKKLSVAGYVTSKGQIENHEVELLGPDGYLDMVKQSHAFVSTLDTQEGFSAEDWKEAKAQQLASWEVAMSGGTQKEAKVVMQAVEGAGYYIREDRPEAVVLMHLKSLKRPEQTKVANHRDGITAAKAWIRNNSAISSYLNMLILEPGKFTTITAI